MRTTSSKPTIGLLVGCQALLNSSTSIMISSGALVGLLIAEDKSLATLPVTATVTGTAMATIPAAMIMRRIGRKFGFIFGASLGVVGAAVASYALILSNFWFFSLGVMMVGMFSAFGQQYRFAAVDVASKEMRSKAVSYVMAGGLIAGFIGPQIASHTKDLYPDFVFLGPYLSLIVLCGLSIFLLSFTRIPQLTSLELNEAQRPLMEIAKQPRFITAALSAMVGFGVMSFIMTATPLAMVGCGLTETDSFNVISFHVVAMFGPSFFTGSLINRFGEYRIILIGSLFGLLSVSVGLMGLDFANFWVALVLLGFSWNFMFIGGTTLLTSTYRPSETAKVQGFNDFLVFAMVATASLTSGQVQIRLGWEWINWSAMPLLLTVAGIAVWQLLKADKTVRAAT